MKINLTQTMYDKLEALAERIGMTPGTLATVAISEYVATKTGSFEIQKEVAEKMAEKLIPEFLPVLQALKEAFEKE